MNELSILLSQTLLISIPLVLAALGGVCSERAGVVNIALEAFLLVGAFVTAVVAHRSGNAWLGLAAGALAGLAFAGLHAALCVSLKAEPIISGLALNLLAAGATEYGSRLIWVGDASRSLPSLPGTDVYAKPVVWLALLAVIGVWGLLEKTPAGLRITAVGESPAACETAGLSVTRLRFFGVGASGVLAGLGGAWLALNVGQFQHGMSAGKGYIAVAAVVFGRWRPTGATLACLLFAASEALGAALERWQVNIPSELIGTLPYVLTIVTMAGLVGKSRAPAALGKVI